MYTITGETEVKGRAASRSGVFIALFAAMICVSSFWTVPFIPGIPLVLKNFTVVLAGALLGTWRGTAAAALYLLGGIAGLPVFANAGGIAAFLSPSGGYLYGYLIGSLATGLIAGKPALQDKKRAFSYCVRVVLALLSGFAVILVCGGLWLVFLNSKSAAPQPALGVFLGGIVPFVIADGLKCALALPITFALRPLAARYLNPSA